MNNLWKCWSSNGDIKLKDVSYTISGFSIAALRTNFVIKDLSVLLDGGLSGPYSCEHIFITHCHSDHTANIPFHLINNRDMTYIYCPVESIDAINTYILSMYKMSTMSDNVYVSDSYKIIGVTGGTTFELNLKGKQYEINVITMDHTVPCVGYGFVEIKMKLKKEYLSLKWTALKELKDSGIVITEPIKSYQFCYLGDTSSKILENPDIYKYRNIMIECTFLHEDELARADEVKHIHWQQLENTIKTHTDNYWLCYHFSQRYKSSDIVEFFKDKQYENLKILANDKELI